MHEDIKIKQILIAAVIAACGVIVPILFHLVGLGSVFLPMFIPLAIGAFFLSPRFAICTGAIVPLASTFLTGMPPLYPPIAFIMAIELAIFCLTISLLRHYTHLHSIIIIIIAILIDRLLLYFLYAIIMPQIHLSATLFTAYDIIKSFPGVILIIIITPAAVKGINSILERTTPQ